MALKVDRYQIGVETDISVFFPYPWGGNERTHRQLLKELSLLTGALVIGAHAPGTGNIFSSTRLRRRLQSERSLGGICDDYAAEVDSILESTGRSVRLLVAQSGQANLGARMQTGRAKPFTHVLLRDGVNLSSSLTPRAYKKRLLQQPPNSEQTNYDDPGRTRNPLRIASNYVRMRAELSAYARTSASDSGRLAALELARDTLLPFTNVTFIGGITDSPEQQHDFANSLAIARHAAHTAQSTNIVAPLNTLIEPGNQADLQNPILLHDHVGIALGTVATARQL